MLRAALVPCFSPLFPRPTISYSVLIDNVCSLGFTHLFILPLPPVPSPLLQSSCLKLGSASKGGLYGWFFSVYYGETGLFCFFLVFFVSRVAKLRLASGLSELIYHLLLCSLWPWSFEGYCGGNLTFIGSAREYKISRPQNT